MKPLLTRYDKIKFLKDLKAGKIKLHEDEAIGYNVTMWQASPGNPNLVETFNEPPGVARQSRLEGDHVTTYRSNEMRVTLNIA